MYTHKKNIYIYVCVCVCVFICLSVGDRLEHAITITSLLASANYSTIHLDFFELKSYKLLYE